MMYLLIRWSRDRTMTSPRPTKEFHRVSRSRDKDRRHPDDDCGDDDEEEDTVGDEEDVVESYPADARSAEAT